MLEEFDCGSLIERTKDDVLQIDEKWRIGNMQPFESLPVSAKQQASARCRPPFVKPPGQAKNSEDADEVRSRKTVLQGLQLIEQDEALDRDVSQSDGDSTQDRCSRFEGLPATSAELLEDEAEKP
jgi:hypothetical protein